MISIAMYCMNLRHRFWDIKIIMENYNYLIPVMRWKRFFVVFDSNYASQIIFLGKLQNENLDINHLQRFWTLIFFAKVGIEVKWMIEG